MGEFDRPFLGSKAVSAGHLTKHQLTLHERLHRDVYIRPGVERTPLVSARAASLWGGADAVLAGFSAAAVLGARWIDVRLPAELIRRGSRRSVPGVEVHADSLLPAEIVTCAGMRVTSPARTAFDLGRRLDVDHAVEVLDALCQATGVSVQEVLEVIANHPKARGNKRLRMVLPLIDGGAQSPPETRTRLLLIRAGLPMPQTQVPIRNEWDFTVATCDLGWERWRTVVEYDGVHHWLDERQRSRDISRYEEIHQLGWRVIRVNAQMLRGERHVIIDRVLRALRAAGCEI